MRLAQLFVIALIASGCSNDASNGQSDAAPPADAPDGTGCTPTTPRSEAVETFLGPSGLQPRIDALIDSAQSTLDVQMYLFTVTEIANRIVAAKQRGVEIRVILDPDEAGNMNVEPIFDTGGIIWKNAPAMYTFSHAKYLIIDHKQVVIMSMNFNVTAMTNERNYGMVDRDPEDIADLQSIFDYDWAIANGQNANEPDLTCTRLLVSPVNSYTRIYSFIMNATTTLDIETLYITDSSIRSAIVAAKQRGVAVRVILEDPSDQSENTATATQFMTYSIPVQYADTQFYLHAKMIIADGVAFVGSENFSPTSLNKNREVGGLAFEPSAVPAIQAQFEADWTATASTPATAN